MNNLIYSGIHNDDFGGMTNIGKIIRDAWVFGLLPETQTCEGWSLGQLEKLYEQVHQAWMPYGHLMSHLPTELRQRYERIHGEAFQQAKAQGWSINELEEDD
ncbi:hypothetical protein THII_0273 [Thioploca ingrica]|uniref:Uncharacterized protein n=1 Tax=Thioploca ingrica TaxID=40754 RepID=A0A090AID3_9GAMM|nr:hypothetical protein THII_0273 [Thioploca ingrica]